MNSNKKKAVFLDRDGVINKVVYHKEVNKPSSPWRFDEFKIISGIKSPLEKLNKKGFVLFIITNQPDITKGLIEKGLTEKINEILIKEFPIKEILVCHHQDHHNCDCRKPKPGMIIKLAKKYNIGLEDSFLIGDNWKDIEAGKSAGCKTILINAEYNKGIKADYRVTNLKDAAKLIEKI